MSERSVRIAAAFAVQPSVRGGGGLCEACVAVLGVSGAGITLLGGTAAGPVCASDDRTAFMEDLQFTLGEGPCREDRFDSSITDFSERYADQNDRDYQAFTDAIRSGGLAAVEGV